MALNSTKKGASKPMSSRVRSADSTQKGQQPKDTEKKNMKSSEFTGQRQSKPSDRLNSKTIDPFRATSNQSLFATVYSNGRIPCRLMHGSVKHKLVWDQPPEEVPFDPILVYLAEGLKETVHPYIFVARQGFMELLETSQAKEKITPVLAKIIVPLRTALAHTDSSVFKDSLKCLVLLSHVAGPSLNAHLKNILAPLAKRTMDRNSKELVLTSLNSLEANGGREAVMAIKAKIPTYTSFS